MSNNKGAPANGRNETEHRFALLTVAYSSVMLFHIHHHHDENTCPAHDPEAVGASFGALLPALDANGVTVIGAWVDPPGHDFFLVVETDDYDALVEGLRPIIPSGTATIQPVGDMAAQVAKRLADNG